MLQGKPARQERLLLVAPRMVCFRRSHCTHLRKLQWGVEEMEKVEVEVEKEKEVVAEEKVEVAAELEGQELNTLQQSMF